MSEYVLAQPQRVNTPPVAKETVSFAEPRLGCDFSRIPALTDRVQQTRPLLRSQLAVQRSPKNGDAGSAPCPYCPEADSTEITESAGRDVS